MKTFVLYLIMCSFVATSCAQNDSVKFEKVVQHKFDLVTQTSDTTVAREIIINCDSVLSRMPFGDSKYYYYVHTKSTMLSFSGKFDESLKNERTFWATKDSTSAKYLELVALEYKMNGNEVKAREYYQKAIEKYETYPQSENVIIAIAGCYLYMEKDDAAKKVLKEYLNTKESKMIKEVLANFKEMKKNISEVIHFMKSENK